MGQGGKRTALVRNWYATGTRVGGGVFRPLFMGGKRRVSSIHHRRDGETAGEWSGCGGDWGHWGYGIGVAGRWGVYQEWGRVAGGRLNRA